MQRKIVEPDEDWLASVQPLFYQGRDVFVSIRYRYNTPLMNFALVRSLDQLRVVIDRCPGGADFTVWPNVTLPCRGQLSSALLEAAQSLIPDTAESLCVFTDSGSESDPRLEGDSWHLAKYMFSELQERMGESVAIGPWSKGGRSITAVKGGIDEPG